MLCLVVITQHQISRHTPTRHWTLVIKDAGPLLTFLSGWMDVPPKIYEAACDYEVFSHFSAISIYHKLQIQRMHCRAKIKDPVIFDSRIVSLHDCTSIFDKHAHILEVVLHVLKQSTKQCMRNCGCDRSFCSFLEKSRYRTYHQRHVLFMADLRMKSM